MIEIKNDLFQIVKRIQKIDKTYKVFFNTALKRYEIYSDFGGRHLEIVSPYKVLDIRTYELVATSRVKDINKILEQMDRQNERLEYKIKSNIRENLLEMAKQFL